MTSRHRSLAAVAGLALLVAACGGTTTSAAPPTATATTAPATTAPTDAPATEAPTEAAAEPSADVSAISDFAARIAALDAYKLSVVVDGPAGRTTIQTTTVSQPVEASRYDLAAADGTNVAIVLIGEDAWISQDGTTFTAVPASTVTGMLSSLRPDVLLGALQLGPIAQELEAEGVETKNGVQAAHYHVDDKTPVPPGSATVPPGMVADFWITDDGLLVAFESAGFSTASGGQFDSLVVQLTNLDDAGLTVERPE